MVHLLCIILNRVQEQFHMLGWHHCQAHLLILVLVGACSTPSQCLGSNFVCVIAYLKMNLRRTSRSWKFSSFKQYACSGFDFMAIGCISGLFSLLTAMLFSLTNVSFWTIMISYWFHQFCQTVATYTVLQIWDWIWTYCNNIKSIYITNKTILLYVWTDVKYSIGVWDNYYTMESLLSRPAETYCSLRYKIQIPYPWLINIDLFNIKVNNLKSFQSASHWLPDSW